MDPSRRRAVMACFAVLGAWVAILELQVLVVPGLSLGPVTSDYAHNAIEVLAGLLCLGGAWQARREQNAWLLIGIGVLAWALGNLYYTVVLYDMESPPIPSPADAGFLLFPVLAMIGVLALVRARTRDVPKTLWTDGSIAALAITAVSAAIVFETALGAAQGKPLAVATALAYPLTDLVLLGVAVGALASTAGGSTAPGCCSPSASSRSGSPTRSTSCSAAGDVRRAGLVRHRLDARPAADRPRLLAAGGRAPAAPPRTGCASSPSARLRLGGAGALIYGCLDRHEPVAVG